VCVREREGERGRERVDYEDEKLLHTFAARLRGSSYSVVERSSTTAGGEGSKDAAAALASAAVDEDGGGGPIVGDEVGAEVFGILTAVAGHRGIVATLRKYKNERAAGARQNTKMSMSHSTFTAILRIGADTGQANMESGNELCKSAAGNPFCGVLRLVLQCHQLRIFSLN
jgi:hypothetical protein